MKKRDLGFAQYALRFDCGMDDFYFDGGNALCAVDALMDMGKREEGELLYIWGAFGCGKSHLLRGFFRDFKLADGEKPALITSGKALWDELMAALCTGSVAELVRHRSALRLLVVEDIDLLLGKEPMQNIFMQLFEALLSSGCSVVLSGGSSFESFPELYALREQFPAMSVELSYPEIESRKNYAAAVCVEWGVYISQESAELLAEQYSSIPQLRGAMFRTALKAAA